MNKFFICLKKEKHSRFAHVFYTTELKSIRSYIKYKIIFHEDNYPLKLKRGYFIDNVISIPTTKTTSLNNFEKRLYE